MTNQEISSTVRERIDLWSHDGEHWRVQVTM